MRVKEPAVRVVVRMTRAGFSLREIAEVLGKSTHTVRLYRRLTNCYGRRRWGAGLAEFLRLKAEGRSNREVALLMNVRTGTVAYYRRVAKSKGLYPVAGRKGKVG